MARSAVLKKTNGPPFVIDQEHGDGWSLYRADCVDVTKGIPDGSLHYSLHSPPFCALYTFSDDPRDMSNNRTESEFMEQYGFLIAELYRATMPGRLASIHVMNLPTSKTHHGYIGLQDFRGDIIRAFQKAGWIYHSEVCIWKDPVTAMQRTKALGLLHKQIVKDSAMSRMGIPDYVVTMRKPGVNPEPVAGPFTVYHGDDPAIAQIGAERAGEHIADSYSVQVWQRYASPVWMDIVQGDVLTHKVARAEADERHIAPLQLTVIRRCLDLWSNPGETIYSPFAGIGSELYVARQMGRLALGAELKDTYYYQAVANLRELEAEQAAGDLLSLMTDP